MMEAKENEESGLRHNEPDTCALPGSLPADAAKPGGGG